MMLRTPLHDPGKLAQKHGRKSDFKLSSVTTSPRIAAMLEESGRLEEAIQSYLELGDSAAAARVALRCPDPERQMANIHLKSGRPAEAGHLLAKLGLSREAAEAYETGRDWARAAYRWEAAGDPRRAAEAYEKAGRVRDAARCFMAAGQPERAVALSSQKRAPAPTSSQAVKLAAQHLAAGDKARAASVLLQMRPTEAGFAKGVLLLAPLLIEEGFFDEALSRLAQLPLGPERLYWEEQVRKAQSALPLIQIAPPTETETGTDTREVTGGRIFPGQRLAGRYDILGRLGRGGMGQVYKAHDLELDETVAIKTLISPADDGGPEQGRLLREVQICRRISHPNVVRVYDVGRFPGGLFVTMEYLNGQSLDRMIDPEQPMPLAQIRGILSEVAEGLREAHGLGIIHRDLKPANVMVTPSRIKILDFGIARLGTDPRMTQAGFVLGSPSYMSPDQLQGMDLDGRSDLYSLGILAYTLLAGREPFESPEPTVLALKHLQEAVPDVRGFRQDTPDAWVAFLDRLLAKNRDDRFQSAAEVHEALRGLPDSSGFATQLAPAPPIL
ncbi:MAG TPA: protein kinase [Thermoanaerobaculia bacterium]|jgi:tetratricopeptide (TPR) repeat protein|nr:protein kinase [Thermoanaerobaculia bacterium]